MDEILDQADTFITENRAMDKHQAFDRRFVGHSIYDLKMF